MTGRRAVIGQGCPTSARAWAGMPSRSSGRKRLWSSSSPRPLTGHIRWSAIGTPMIRRPRRVPLEAAPTDRRDPAEALPLQGRAGGIGEGAVYLDRGHRLGAEAAGEETSVPACARPDCEDALSGLRVEVGERPGDGRRSGRRR